ncbi:class I SAM-dependent methyltransferase [Sphingomonas sp. BIUV-7]|uniref:Class I SAM-dependent methyltransferase n=1 Tax=Sphingomonas natans TaxID=3063330 RepID=A0ABT8Y5Y1_9SPHN|nr:class I SAM-dependent methyltransferase [Sphingomonas sp. BIUV-7]MDO6413724.1 class I SAM-dependent methyltransferase [Sphingomonas sp. BIUV-7]
MQFEFLKNQGLQPDHTLLDVGCGSLRGGVHFVRYLDPGNYIGLDMSRSLLNAGYDIELASAGIQDRLPRENLICDSSFKVPCASGTLDFALAVSVFTHLSLNRIRQCLTNVAPVMRSGGMFYATFFELPEATARGKPVQHAGGVVTSDVDDPYHYSLQDLAYLVEDLPWRLQPIGAWNHPRGSI